jgi:hypothetical protein
MSSVNVKIRFAGPVAREAGLREMYYPIHAEREKGLNDIAALVLEKAGPQALYTVLMNGSSIDLNSKTVFEDTDVFDIVPIVLGG